MKSSTINLDKPLLINEIIRPPSRRCSQCGKPYFRRNLTEVWTIRNPGKRLGWRKEIAKVCLGCMDKAQAKEIIEICDVQFTKKDIIRKNGK